MAFITSSLAFLYFKHNSSTLAYKDSISHLVIARRILESPTPGLAQLGGVWLPLPHLLMLPLIWIDSLYYSGFAGSIVSMGAYVVTSVFLYKIVRTLTGGNTAAGVIGALFFMVNPNILYMQSTPMTELLLFACLVGMVYGVQRWIQTDGYLYLVGAGAAAFFGTLTRYEAWVLLAALTGVVAFVSWRKHHTYRQAEGLLLGFLFLGAAGIAGWLMWNQLIFGNALNFQGGAYAKPSLWVGSADRAVGNWVIALKTYWYATVDNLSLVGTLVAIGCLGMLLIIRRRPTMDSLPSVALLVFFPFFVLALEKGQRPLHVPQISGNLYNVRFGLLMILPTAVVIGCAASLLMRRPIGQAAIGAATCVFLLICSATLARPSLIPTLHEAKVFLADGKNLDSHSVSAYLRAHYHGGVVLMESFGNETLLEEAHIGLGQNLYEGSYKLWDRALANPTQFKVDWIIMRYTPGDADIVYDKLHASPALQHYGLVYQNKAYHVFEART